MENRRKPNRSGRSFGRRLISLAGKLSISLVTIMLLLIAAEISTRLFSDVQPPLHLRHPVLGRIYRPNFETSVFVAEAGREVPVRFNREGFRGVSLPYERDANARRVAVLGDSFIAALGCDEADTAVAVLERLLDSSHPDIDWQVMNFGISASSTAQQVVLFREVVSRYEPDLVLAAYYIGNDFSDNSFELSNYPRIYFEIGDDDELILRTPPLNRTAGSAWLNTHSRFYVWRKYWTTRARRKARAAVRPLAPRDRVYESEPDELLQRVWRVNERAVEAIHEEVTATGTPMVVLLLPTPQQVYSDEWEDLLGRRGEDPPAFGRDYPNTRLTDLCRRQGIPVLPLIEAFRRVTGDQTVDETPADEYLFFSGIGHFNENGNRLVAEEVHRYLTEGEGLEIFWDLLGERGPEEPEHGSLVTDDLAREGAL